MKRDLTLNIKVCLLICLMFLAFFLSVPARGEEPPEGEEIWQYCGSARLEEVYVRLLREKQELYANDPIKLHKLMHPSVKRQERYVVGDERDWRFDFIEGDGIPNETVKRMEVTAVGSHCYVWQEVAIPPTGGATAADVQTEFDNTIYNTNRTHFGDEPNVDGDVRVHILFLAIDGPKNLMGYFWGYNEHPATEPGFENSNEAECIIVDSDESRNDVFQATAHEFQHMIHWQEDAGHDEEHWVNEGCSKMAEYFCYGSETWYDQESHLGAFQNQPERSLTEWTNYNHDYGQVYAFFFYLWEKIDEFLGVGDLAIRMIVQEDANGVTGINNVLGLAGINMDLVHRYWAIACYLDDTSQLSGLGGYTHDINQAWGGGPVDGHIQLKFAADGDGYYYGTTITDYPREGNCTGYLFDPWGVGYYEFQANPAIFNPSDTMMLKQMDVLFDGSSGSPAPVVVKKNTAGGTVAISDIILNANQEGHSFTDNFGNDYNRVALLVLNQSNTNTTYNYRGITEPKPISPAHDTQICGGEGSLPPTFEWDGMGNNRYCIQFSTDPDFHTVAYSSSILQDTQWTMPDDVWDLVNQIIETQEELTLYWRVLGGFMNASDQLISDVHTSPIFKLKVGKCQECVWFEGWESAGVGGYSEGDVIHADSGFWAVTGDSLEYPVEIVPGNVIKLIVKHPDEPRVWPPSTFCLTSAIMVPLTPDVHLSFMEQGELPPSDDDEIASGSEVSLRIGVVNILKMDAKWIYYVLQRGPYFDPPGHWVGPPILLEESGGTYSRNLWDDFASFYGELLNYVVWDIGLEVRVSRSPGGTGWATWDDVCIFPEESKIKVTRIQFYCDGSNAIPLREDYLTDIKTPEWIKDTKSDPALYIKNTAVTIRARFEADESVKSARIQKEEKGTVLFFR